MRYRYLCAMIRYANCKINVGLDVLRRRPDGYHDLETAMYPVRGLYDVLEIRPAPDDAFRATGLALDCSPADNLCMKAVRLMRERYGIGGVAVMLDKRVPFGAGLGGGSSDATAVILAVDEIYGLHLSEEEWIDCAAALGSDTAFFVRNTPQLCSGRGERMEPLELDFEGLQLAIVPSAEGVSTREAYAGVRPAFPEVPLAERLVRPIEKWQACVKNDFEPTVFAARPAIRQAKERLLSAGALFASMSGSGSAVYGLFDPRRRAAPDWAMIYEL